jgi:hypothetical protein
MRAPGLLWMGVLGLLLLGTADPGLPQESRRRPAPPEKQRLPTSAVPAGDVGRGEDLVERVVFCVECHSPRDSEGDIIRSEAFTGGPIPFRPPWPNDWALRAPRNRGLPGYTPELGLRLFMMGSVDREGNQLRPPMPRFRMTPQDAADVVVYMSSLK